MSESLSDNSVSILTDKPDLSLLGKTLEDQSEALPLIFPNTKKAKEQRRLIEMKKD